MGEFDGKVALVTGAARGQGRSHALRLAAEGADIVAIDVCKNVPSMDYDLASEADLQETAKLIEDLDRRVVTAVADVRDRTAMKTAVDSAVAELGGLDVVCANAGICIMRPWHEVTEEIWDDQVDTNLKGVWNTLVATVPHLIERGGGSIVITASAAGVKAYPYLAPYVAAKHGLIGLAKEMANELAFEQDSRELREPERREHEAARGSRWLPGTDGPRPALRAVVHQCAGHRDGRARGDHGCGRLARLGPFACHHRPQLAPRPRQSDPMTHLITNVMHNSNGDWNTHV